MERHQDVLELICEEIDTVLKKVDKLFLRETEEFYKIFKKLEKSIKANSMSSTSRHLKNLAILIFLADSRAVNDFVRDTRISIFPVFFKDQIMKARINICSRFGENPCLIGELQKVDKVFYDLCKNNLRSKKGNLDVDLISKILGLSIVRKSSRTYEEVLGEIVFKLNKLRPAVFNYDWFYENARNELYFLNEKIKKDEMIWDDFLNSLPAEWRATWSGRKKGANFYSSLRELRLFLERDNPDTFNVRYIYFKCNSVWHYFSENFRSIYGEGVNWDLVIRHLPLKWQYRWSGERRTERSQHSKYYLETAIDDFLVLLNKHKPEKFTPHFIKSKNPQLYDYFISRVKDENGYVDWRLIVSCLGDKWSKRFVYPKNYYYSLPEKFYEDPKELERVIKDQRLDLYVFFCPSNQENRQECDRVSRALIAVAQKGNIEAYALLKEYLEQITAFWIQNNRQLASLLHLRREVNKVIRRCIYMFTFGEKKLFLTYVYRSLVYMAKAYRKKEDLRLDANIGDSKRTYHDIIMADDNW